MDRAEREAQGGVVVGLGVTTLAKESNGRRPGWWTLRLHDEGTLGVQGSQAPTPGDFSRSGAWGYPATERGFRPPEF